jgi:hypothetical protein
MGESRWQSRLLRGAGVALLLVGIAVFAVRLQHPGPYAVPGGGNLRAGLLALLLGGGLASGLGPNLPITRWLRWAALAASPIVLFFSLYAVLAEVEEVVTLRTTDEAGRPANLRLWIVDFDGAEWVRMPVAKADAHTLRDDRARLLRNGEDRCVRVSRYTQPGLVAEIERLAYEKYGVKRLATVIGLFSKEPSPGQLALRLDPCDDGAAGVK